MKDDRQKKTAETLGMLEKVENLEKDLLTIPGVVEIDFDLDGFYDNLNEVVFSAKYDIPPNDKEYFNKAAALQRDVIQTAEKHNLAKLPDRIEDYGEHFYFVFTGIGDEWKIKEEAKMEEKTETKPVKVLVEGKPRKISSVFNAAERDITENELEDIINAVKMYNYAETTNNEAYLADFIYHDLPPSEVMNDIVYNKGSECKYAMSENAFKWWQNYTAKLNEAHQLKKLIPTEILDENNYRLKLFDFSTTDMNGIANYSCELLRCYAEREGIDISKIKKVPNLPEKSINSLWKEKTNSANEKAERTEEKTMAKAKYSDKQVAAFRKFLRAGYDLEAVKNPDFTENQLKELYLGLKSGLDISLYNNPKISAEEMKELRKSAAKGVNLQRFAEAVINTGEYNKEQTLQILDAAKHGVNYSRMLNPELDHLQMRQIKLGERYGIDTSVYATADFSAEQMQQLRLELIVRRVMENIKNFFKEAWEKIFKTAEHNITDEEAANIREAVSAHSEQGLADKLFSNATLIIISSNIYDKVAEQVLEAEAGLENETILNSMDMAETVSEELAAEADEESDIKERSGTEEKEVESGDKANASEAELENEYGILSSEEEYFEMEEVM